MVAVTAERFLGIADFEGCLNGGRMTIDGFDANGDLFVDRPNDPVAVAAVQQALADLTYAIEVTGVYDAQTAAVVRQFKNDQLLPLPPGMSQHDGVTGPGTTKRLNEIFTEEPSTPGDDPELHYTDRKSHYTNVALAKANAGAHADWTPELGFAANRPRMVDVYNYDRDLYLAAPERFLWAGLGRMAGGAVVGGLDTDPAGFINQVIMVRIGRDIFFDLAWMHEAFLDRPDTVIELATLHDQFNTYPRYDALGVVTYQRGTPARSYARAWDKILSGDPAQVAAGNRDLLENEQWSIIQPHYDHLRTLPHAGLPTPFTGNIHPYHRDFIIEVPQGDILLAGDRWTWITGDMYTKWTMLSPAERTRLVSLPFDRILAHDFGIPGQPDLLPPGGP